MEETKKVFNLCKNFNDIEDLLSNLSDKDLNSVLNHKIRIFRVFTSLPIADRPSKDIFKDILKMCASNEFLEHIKFFEIVDNDEIPIIIFKTNNLADHHNTDHIMIGVHPDDKDNILFDNMLKPYHGSSYTTLDYLSESIKKFADCEYVLFHPEYATSKECLVEEFVASRYDKKRFYIKDMEDLNLAVKYKINSTLLIHQTI